jgi:hypothetical protein
MMRRGIRDSILARNASDCCDISRRLCLTEKLKEKIGCEERLEKQMRKKITLGT